MNKAVANSPSQAPNVENADQKASVKVPLLKRKKIVFGGIGIVLIGIVFAGLFFSGMLHKLMGGHQPVLLAGPVFVKLPEIVTNLSGNDGQDSYAKLKVTLEVTDSKAANFVRTNMPKFVDVFQTYLRSMQPGELGGASGTYRLKEALISRVRIVAAPVQIQDVLFEELIVQ